MQTFTVVGSDGEKYGPHALDVVQSWINEGRISRDTMVLKDGDMVWKKAEDLEDFVFKREEPQLAAVTAASGTANPSVAGHTRDPRYDQLVELAPQVKSGANWFYWIAALTLINAGLAFTGSDTRFIIGIALADVFFVIGSALGSIGTAVSVGLNLLLIGAFILFGIKGNQAKVWPFILGMLIFGVDTILLLIAESWIGVAIHVWALFSMFLGCKASWAAQKVAKQSLAGTAAYS